MKRYGLIGEKLGHSASPRLHALLADYPYDLYELPPDRLEAFLQSTDCAGLNVTIPYKQAVIPFCAELTDTARRIGSVNTLTRLPSGGWLGDNTDAWGFAALARHAGVDFAGKKALVLGSGGTSKTACAVVRQAGGTPIVVSRSGETTYENIADLKDAEVLINATPVGMYPRVDDRLVDLTLLPNLRSVLDVVYNPLRTRLLQQAQSLGLRCAGGLYMLCGQAARAVERFTGQAVPPEKLEAAYATLHRQSTNIALVGMPGCGKSTLARLLAKRLDRPLWDIDAMIAEESGKSIPQLFADEGESGFRAREREIIARVGLRQGGVIAAGGGAVLSEHNRAALRQNSLVVRIERSLALLDTRGRPLSQSKDALQKLAEQREPCYRAAADVSIQNTASLMDAVNEIVRAYQSAAER